MRAYSLLLTIIVALSSASFAQDPSAGANKRIDGSEKTTTGLSNDIGKMADRIGTMADKITEAQKIQSKNYNNTLNKVKK